MLASIFSFSQKENREQLLALKKANNFVYEGNELIEDKDFVSAEMAYRKAISEQPTITVGSYNLGTSYYNSGNFDEALYRLGLAVETATSKAEKHKAFHNIGNILMQNKKCEEAVESYKNALRNNPADDETRYNLSVAKNCAEEQQKQEDQNKDDKKDQDKKDENKDNKDQKDKEEKKENQDNKDKEGDDKEDKKDKGDEEKKEDEKKDDEGKPKDEKKNKGDEEKKKEQQKPQPQPGQLSPQQIQNLLEAMNNQEQKVQEKMNAEKQKGVKIKTDKDW